MDIEEVGSPAGRKALESAHRAHMREMTAARQAAERARGIRNGNLASRQVRAEAYEAEMERIAEEHRAWLRRWTAQEGR